MKIVEQRACAGPDLAKKESLARKIRLCQPLRAGEPMVRRGDEHVGMRANSEGLDRDVARRAAGQSHFDLAGAKRLDGRVAVADQEAQVDLGPGGDETGDQPGGEVLCRRRRADGEPTALSRRNRMHGFSEVAHRPPDAARSLERRFAGGSEAHAG